MEAVYQHAAAVFSRRRFPAYGLAGILSILVAEVLLFLDPGTYWLRGRSLLRCLEQGDYAIPIALVGSGLLCGLLWEFLNYWATAKWVYNVPISFVGPKLFEMPLLGYLGFIPFAFECYTMQQFLLAMVPSLSTQRRRPL